MLQLLHLHEGLWFFSLNRLFLHVILYSFSCYMYFISKSLSIKSSLALANIVHSLSNGVFGYQGRQTPCDCGFSLTAPRAAATARLADLKKEKKKEKYLNML